jgi:hypothetical protein
VAGLAGTYLGCTDTAIARATGVSRQAVRRARVRGIELAEASGTRWETFFDISSSDGGTTAS